MSSRRPAIAVVGTGRLARALVPALAGARYPVVVHGRRPASARALIRLVSGARAETRMDSAVRDAAIVSLAVPDAALAPLARSLAASSIDWKDRIVLHHAGALGPEILEPLAHRAAATGVLHPLQALGGSVDAAGLLAGSRARIEGAPPARTAARRIARDLGMVPLPHRGAWTPERRAAYHAAASLVSNDVVALLASGVDLLVASGVGRRAALEALIPLCAGALRQAGREGLAAALSGPVTRGDAATLRAQLEALARHSDDAREAHRRLSLLLLELAREQRRGPDEAGTRRLRRALGPAAGGRRPGRTV